MGYLANFMVYTLAMVGVIVVALLVFKNATFQGGGHKSKYLKILDTMTLAPRKTLYIISTGSEKFLIAGDADKTTLISKLEGTEENVLTSIQENAPCVPSPPERARERVYKPLDTQSPQVKPTFQQTMSHLASASYMDKGIGINSSILHTNNNKNNNSVIRSMLQNLK